MKEIKIKDIKIGEIDVIKASISVIGNGYNTKEWRNLKQRARRNGYSLPKQALVDAIKKTIKESGTLHKKYDYVLVAELEPCGGKAMFKTWDDIPNESVPCPCGDPIHWLIKYEDRRCLE